MGKKTTEAQRKAVYRYDDKFDRINCRLEKGVAERIKALGYKSANAFIVDAVMEKLQKEEFEPKMQSNELMDSLFEDFWED